MFHAEGDAVVPGEVWGQRCWSNTVIVGKGVGSPEITAVGCNGSVLDFCLLMADIKRLDLTGRQDCPVACLISDATFDSWCELGEPPKICQGRRLPLHTEAILAHLGSKGSRVGRKKGSWWPCRIVPPDHLKVNIETFGSLARWVTVAPGASRRLCTRKDMTHLGSEKKIESSVGLPMRAPRFGSGYQSWLP